MGFFSSIWKGVKKGFKKLFKPIKGVFKAFGKFMNKIGIVGQIAMMFIPIPGLGFLMNKLASGAKWLSGALGQSSNIIARGAKFMLDGAMKVGGKISSGFKTITEGVKSFIGNSTKYLANKIPGIDIATAPTSFFGKGSESVLGRTSEAMTKNWNDFLGRSTDKSDIFGPGGEAASAPGDAPYYEGSGTPQAKLKQDLPGALENMFPGEANAAQRKAIMEGYKLTPKVQPKSLLGRIGEGLQKVPQKIAEIPGKTVDYFTEGGFGEDIGALPGKLGERAVVQAGMNALFKEDPLRPKRGVAIQPRDTYESDLLAHQMRSFDSPIEAFSNYIVDPMEMDTTKGGIWGMNLQQRTPQYV